MIMNIIRPHVDNHYGINHSSFKRGGTTTSQITTLKRLIEGVKYNNQESILKFIDFKKAFDNIHRTILTILKSYGIPEELLTGISIMYEDTTTNVGLTLDGETDTFKLKGDTLASYIFVIVNIMLWE